MNFSRFHKNCYRKLKFKKKKPAIIGEVLPSETNTCSFEIKSKELNAPEEQNLCEKNKLSRSSYTIETLETNDVKSTSENIEFWELNNCKDVYNEDLVSFNDDMGFYMNKSYKDPSLLEAVVTDPS